MFALPPPAYDFPYPGPVIEWVRPASEVERLCRQAGARVPFGATIMACAFKIGRTCYMILPHVGPGGTSRYMQGQLRHHENGHCNGWTHN